MGIFVGGHPWRCYLGVGERGDSGGMVVLGIGGGMSAESAEVRARIRAIEKDLHAALEEAERLEEDERKVQEAAEKCKAQADTAELRAALLELSKLGVVTYNAVLTPEMETIEGAALVALKACVEWIGARS